MSIFNLFGISFFFNISEYVLSLVSTVFITKKLSVFDFGNYNLLNTIAGLVFTFFSLGLSQYNYKILPGRDKPEQDKIIGNSLFVELVSSVFGLAAIILLVKNKLEVGKIVIIFFILKVLYCVINYELIRCLGYRKKNVLKSVFAFINEKFWVIPLLVIISFGKTVSLNSIFCIQSIISFIVLLCLLFVFRSKILFKNFCFNKQFIKDYIGKSISFVFIDVGMYFLESGVRYILFSYGTKDSVGLYSFGYNWISIIFKFGMLLVYLLQPYFSNEYYKIEKNEVSNYTKLYNYENFALKYSMYIIVFALTFFLLNFDELVILIGKSDYLKTKDSVFMFSLLPITMCLTYFFQILLVLAGKTKEIPICYCIVVVAVIVANYFFVPLFDYKASALITSISYCILMIVFYIICPKNLFHFNLHFFDFLSFFLFLIVFAISVLLIKKLQISFIKYLLDFFLILITMFLICLVNKKDFKFFKTEHLS